MQECTGVDLARLYPAAEDQSELIAAHLAANQFLCPVLTNVGELKIFNQFGNINAQYINVKFKECLRTEQSTCNLNTAKQLYFNAKYLMVLTNTQSVDNTQATVQGLKNESRLHWLSFSMDMPMTTQITAQRFQYQTDEDHGAKLLVRSQPAYSGFEIAEKNIQTWQYQNGQTNLDKVVHMLTFDVS